MSVPGASLRDLQQSLITYAIKDGVAMRSAIDALRHSGSIQEAREAGHGLVRHP